MNGVFAICFWTVGLVVSLISIAFTVLRRIIGRICEIAQGEAIQ